MRRNTATRGQGGDVVCRSTTIRRKYKLVLEPIATMEIERGTYHQRENRGQLKTRTIPLELEDCCWLSPKREHTVDEEVEKNQDRFRQGP